MHATYSSYSPYSLHSSYMCDCSLTIHQATYDCSAYYTTYRSTIYIYTIWDVPSQTGPRTTALHTIPHISVLLLYIYIPSHTIPSHTIPHTTALHTIPHITLLYIYTIIYYTTHDGTAYYTTRSGLHYILIPQSTSVFCKESGGGTRQHTHLLRRCEEEQV